MLAKLPLANQFYNFVASKAPDETYDYCDAKICACGQFIREVMGVEPRTGTTEWAEAWDQMHLRQKDLTYGLNWIARGTWGDEQWTFGALRARLEKHLPECVG